MKLFVATLVFIGLLMPRQLDALTCYQCKAENANCANPGLLAIFTLGTCSISSGVCSKVKVGGSVTRGCVPVCASLSLFGSGMSCCSSYRCNVGTSLVPGLNTLLAFSTASLLLAMKSLF